MLIIPDMMLQSSKINIGGGVEILSYTSSPQVRAKGKGLGEQDIVRYALEESVFLKDADYIIKITGRIKVISINRLIDLIRKRLSKKRKWVVAEKLYKAKWVRSYCFAAHKDFFSKDFFDEMQNISETEENLVAFEECLYRLLVRWKEKKENGLYQVLSPIQVDGHSAGDGSNYRHNTMRDYIKCAIDAFRIDVLGRF